MSVTFMPFVWLVLCIIEGTLRDIPTKQRNTKYLHGALRLSSTKGDIVLTFEGRRGILK